MPRSEIRHYLRLWTLDFGLKIDNFRKGIMTEDKLSTGQKALAINVDLKKFGTFAEIGAGQEVARWFFHVGRAAGTVAKSISAYGMAISDDLYGPTAHYVSRSRLEAMLATEFEQLQKRRPEKPAGH